MRFVLNRDVTREECEWLDGLIAEGTEVYECTRNTYGCCTSEGVACTYSPDGDYPFFELPEDALTPVVDIEKK